MWKIKFIEDGNLATYISDTHGGILSAIEDFYSKYKWKPIMSVTWAGANKY